VNVEGWDIGRAWKAPDGTLTFYIRKQVGGSRFDHCTGATTLPAAMKHRERFQADPAGYRPEGDPKRTTIRLDNDLSEAFLAWSLNTKKNTPKYVADQRTYLAWWMEKLRGVDLRARDPQAMLRDKILPKLDGATARQQRIATIKVLYSWLRTERHWIATHEDPTYGMLKVPQSIPEQRTTNKVVPVEHLLLVIDGLASNRWRDLLRVLMGTGMHVSELVRFAQSGTLEPLPRERLSEDEAGVIVIPWTKGGEVLRVPVSQPVLDAAKRVLEAGAFDRSKLDAAIRSACAAVVRPDGKVGIPAFGPGRLRHTVSTFAKNNGTDIKTISEFLGHKSPRTTAKFYATNATPRKIRTIL
jgi:integrase